MGTLKLPKDNLIEDTMHMIYIEREKEERKRMRIEGKRAKSGKRVGGVEERLVEELSFTIFKIHLICR